DRDGKLRGLRGLLVHDMGAYTASGASQPDIIVPHMLSAYVMPAMEFESQVVFTNAVPSGFIRGGGRPLGNYAVERVIDQLARALKLSPVELRRRNLVQPEQIPFTTGYPAGRRGLVYDSGDYPKIRVTAGDTANTPPADLTAGSRSAVQVGNATARAATAMRKRLLDRAGDVLEADAADLVIEDGVIGVRGAPSKSVPVSEVVPAE